MQHLRMHKGEKPYECSFEGCLQTFTTSSNRDDHKRRHELEKPYACLFPGCKAVYYRRYQLNSHKMTKHRDSTMGCLHQATLKIKSKKISKIGEHTKSLTFSVKLSDMAQTENEQMMVSIPGFTSKPQVEVYEERLSQVKNFFQNCQEFQNIKHLPNSMTKSQVQPVSKQIF